MHELFSIVNAFLNSLSSLAKAKVQKLEIGGIQELGYFWPSTQWVIHLTNSWQVAGIEVKLSYAWIVFNSKRVFELTIEFR